MLTDHESRSSRRWSAMWKVRRSRSRWIPHGPAQARRWPRRITLADRTTSSDPPRLTRSSPGRLVPSKGARSCSRSTSRASRAWRCGGSAHSPASSRCWASRSLTTDSWTGRPWTRRPCLIGSWPASRCTTRKSMDADSRASDLWSSSADSTHANSAGASRSTPTSCSTRLAFRRLRAGGEDAPVKR